MSVYAFVQTVTLFVRQLPCGCPDGYNGKIGIANTTARSNSKRRIISMPLDKQAKCSARNGAGRAAFTRFYSMSGTGIGTRVFTQHPRDKSTQRTQVAAQLVRLCCLWRSASCIEGDFLVLG